MYHFRQHWITVCCLLLSLMSSLNGQNDPEFKHELPPGVELVNPKDFGLSDADLGNLLGNVKVLGGGQIGDTKTQILTVGFEGDEDLNFDDFEIPGLTDKKSSNMPDKDKEIANVAFEKFKEFFKDPKNSPKPSDEPKSSSPKPHPLPAPRKQDFVSQARQQNFPTLSRKPENARDSHQQIFPSPTSQQENAKLNIQSQSPLSQMLQLHYPVTLTQPDTGIIHITTSRPTTQLIQQQRQNEGPRAPVGVQYQHQHNLPPRGQSTTPSYSQRQHKQNPSQNYVTPMIKAQAAFNNLRVNKHQNPQNNNNHQNPQNNNNHQNSQNNNNHQNLQNNNNHQNPQNSNNHQNSQNNINHQNFQNNNNHQNHQNNYQNHNLNHQQHTQNQPHQASEEFGAKIRYTQRPTYASQPQGNPIPPKNHYAPYQNQVTTPQQNKHIQTTQSTPSTGSFQRFTLYHQNQKQSQSSPNPSTSASDPFASVVRNQYSTLPDNYQSSSPKISQHHQEPTQQSPAPSPSSSIPSLIPRFPVLDPQQRPVSHVYIQHQNQVSTVQQTSFHPVFQPPTTFVNNFTPSVNHITTPSPNFEVTPSMPMILISTNENAITDPERMERLRQMQKHREELRLREQQRIKEDSEKKEQQYRKNQQQREREPHALNYQQSPQVSSQTKYLQSNDGEQSNHHPVNDHRFNQDYNRNTATQIRTVPNTIKQYEEYHQQQQNTVNFQAQQQKHQLYNLQNQQGFYDHRQNQNLQQSTQQQQHHNYGNYNQNQYQQQYQAQASNNYQQHQIPSQMTLHGTFPPRYAIQGQFGGPYGGRHKRGYRHRLTSILRGLWRDRD